MPPKRKGKASSTAASKRSKKTTTTTSSPSSKKKKEEPEKPMLQFERYATDEEITAEGLEKLAEDLGIDAASDTKLLALCWRLGAEKPGVVSKAEWAKLSTCAELPTFGETPPTLESLKKNWNQLDPGFLDNAEFRPFYKFCFEFNREGTKKFLEKDTAIALLPLCIENRSPHTKAFVEFLEASKPADFKLNKDQWCSFLDFSLTVSRDFREWDADESSWPILLDEFVEHVKAERAKEDDAERKDDDDDEAKSAAAKKSPSKKKKK